MTSSCILATAVHTTSSMMRGNYLPELQHAKLWFILHNPYLNDRFVNEEIHHHSPHHVETRTPLVYQMGKTSRLITC